MSDRNPPEKNTAATAPKPDATDRLAIALEEEVPQMRTPPAASLAGFETEEESRGWAMEKVHLNPTYAKWESLGASTVEGLALKESRLETQIGRISSQIDLEPYTIELTIFDDLYHKNFSVLASMAKKFALICWAVCIAVISSVLAAESGFEVTAAMESRHGFLQNGWGAFCMVFSVSFGSFFVLTFWLAAEKGTWNWAPKMVARVGALGSVSLVLVLGIVLGKPEDAFFAWPMVLMPLGAIVLICSAIGAKEGFVRVCTKAFPVKEVKNEKIADLWKEYAELEKPIRKLKERKAMGQKLLERATSFTEEFAGRVVEVWRRVKHWEEIEAASRKASGRQMLASVEEKVAAEEFKNFVRPE